MTVDFVKKGEEMEMQTYFNLVKTNLSLLRESDFIPNTYGKCCDIARGLNFLDANFSTEGLSREELQELNKMCVFMEDNPLVFGIPEKYLVNRCISHAKSIKDKLLKRKNHDNHESY